MNYFQWYQSSGASFTVPRGMLSVLFPYLEAIYLAAAPERVGQVGALAPSLAGGPERLDRAAPAPPQPSHSQNLPPIGEEVGKPARFAALSVSR